MSEILTISIKDAVFHSFHGVFEQEQIVGNDFQVSVDVIIPMSKEILNDNLSNTISYVDIYRITEQEMAKPSKLLENVAYRIICSLKDICDEILQIDVEIIKIAPPIAKIDGSARIKLKYQKN